MRDPTMAAATLVGRAGRGHEAPPAGNENGAMMGFMGLGMAAQQAGGLNAQGLFQMGQQQAAQQQQQAQQQQAPAADGWTCELRRDGVRATSAGDCGAKTRPAAAPAPGSWTCACGADEHRKILLPPAARRVPADDGPGRAPAAR